MPFCEKCGGSIEPGSKFCDNCGVPLDNQSTPQPTNRQEPAQTPTFQGSPAPAAPPASAPIPPIYIAAGIVVVVIIIALVFASGAMSGHPGPGVKPTVTVTATSTPTPRTTTLPVTTMAVPGTGSAKDWNSLGIKLSNNGDYQGALYADEKAIALDPTNGAYLNNKGNDLNSLKRYSEALIAVEKAITLDPTSKYAWNTKGAVLQNLNRYPEALIAYEKAIALDPTWQTAINNKKNLEAKMKTTVVSGKDPIIGVWRYSDPPNYDFRYRFNADGTWVSSTYLDPTMTLGLDGTWSSIGSNSYTLRYSGTDRIETFIYDPAKNAISNGGLSYTPYQGDVAAKKGL